jgi:hypothetical protein
MASHLIPRLDALHHREHEVGAFVVRRPTFAAGVDELRNQRLKEISGRGADGFRQKNAGGLGMRVIKSDL